MMQLRTRIGLGLVGADFWAFVSKRERRMVDLEAEIEKLELQHARSVRNLIQRFITSLDEEVDEDVLRDGLEQGLADLKDHVARLEEHG